MKKLAFIVLAAVAFAMPLHAQNPEASPTPAAVSAPAPPTLALTAPDNTRAAIAAGQIIGQVNATVTTLNRLLNEGVPARGNQPAISSDAIKTALGAENVAKIEKAKAVLQGQ